MFRKVKEKFLNMYRSDRVLLGEWILTIVTAVFLFVSVVFVDMRSLTVWSTNVWDVTFDSNIRHLYEYTAKNVQGVRHTQMGSELFSVLPWSIWNFPIWLVQRLTGKDIADSAIMLAYSKMFLVVVSLIMLRFTKKLTYLVTGNRTQTTWAVFLSASSTFLFLGVLYAGQNDIFMLTASVIGIYYLIKGKQKWFMVWSIIAIAIKPFFVVAFLAVLLLYEKSIIKAVLKLALGISGVVAQKLLFYGAPMYKESIEEGPSKDLLEQIFSGNVSTAFGSVSFFAIALVLIYLYSYTRGFSKDDIRSQNNRFARYVVYIVAVTNMAYLMFSPFTYYRLVMLVPFLYIVMVQREEVYFYNGLLETSMAVSLVFKMGLRNNTSLFRAKAVNGALIQRFFGYSVTANFEEGKYTSINTYLTDQESLLMHWQPLFSGVALVAGILLLVFNHPDKKVKAPLYGNKNCRALLWVRIVLMIPFVLMVIWLFSKAPIKHY